MIHPLIGQNAQAGQAGGSGFNSFGTIAPDPSVVNPVTGGSGSALSNDTNFLLFFLNNGAGAAGAASGTGLPTQTTGAPNDTSETQGATSLEAQLLKDVGSFVSTLTGNGASTASLLSGAGTPAATSTLEQDIDAITPTADTAVLASAGGLAPSTSGGGSDVGNTGSASASPSWQHGWDDGRGTVDAWRQQFGLATYSASGLSGQTSATSSALQSITA